MANYRKKKQQLWYLRRGQNVQGPFPAGLVTSYILLGRIKDTDELSDDKRTWRLVPDIPELQPAAGQADMRDAEDKERFQAAKRWADERRLLDRRNKSTEPDYGAGGEASTKKRARGDRRQSEPYQALEKRDVADAGTEEKTRTGSSRTVPVLIVIAIVVTAIAVLLMIKPVTDSGNIDCDQPPSAGVVWNNCFMQGASYKRVNLTGAEMKNMQLSGATFQGSTMAGADLSYSVLSIANLRNTDLRNAIMKGVQLRGADLSNSTLDGADLSYADLNGVVISGASFNNTILDNAIWVDGRVCAPGSVGQCL